ncbi:Zn(II)2Cys6 transcription factor [Aspergillus affinis]|uniref:Zn(II)2Cys6 transcription factor n=1 Tax=Aspergillus affinis TaxID=1070780 RepID=UPI0022FE13C3|nr:uncharacterized protein KD926_000110 [Aspergillus affinis]KAI9037694.1 hypothetical protein KD926_000110 [Aspergillus affinis]
MATETRSHDGCWTCRLRKKKCDEKRPICTECMCVGLECHGFGEKPAWMDRGARQKAQAAKMKQKVAQATRNRRVNQFREQHESSAKFLQNKPVANSTSTQACIPVSEPVVQQQPFADPFEPTSYARDDMATVMDHLPMIDHTTAGFQASLDEMTFLSDSNFDLPEIDTIATDDIRLPINPPILCAPEGLRDSYSVPKFQSNLGLSPSGATSMLSITNVDDAILLAHYLNQVFPWQFRFCSLSLSEFNQGYFIWLMSKSRPLYLASLALSSSYRGLQKSVDESPAHQKFEEHMERYDLATEELQRNLKEHKSTDDVSMLACIVSFICSSQFLHAGKIDWNMHLQAGTSIIAPWISQQVETKQGVPKTPEESSRDFFIGSIVRFDILSAITKDATPGLCDKYRNLLKSGHPIIKLETVCGCQNWVFDLLLDVYLLRDWKKTTRAAGLLSLWELTARANAIKTDLERRITGNLILMNQFKQDLEVRHDDNMQSRYSKYHICVVTHAFACSVSVLLEVIVSGAYPQMPEIKQKVGRSVESFAYVDDPDLLEVLCWPLFVVGCVTEADQYDFFRRLLSSSQVPRSESLYGIFNHLEKCWKLRECGEVVADNFEFSLFRTSKSGDVLIA